mgnify:CR=1 FL=1
MDLADEAGATIEMFQQQQERRIRNAAAGIPKGVAGDCAECGDYNQRLVEGVCSPCRDVLDEIAKRS